MIKDPMDDKAFGDDYIGQIEALKNLLNVYRETRDVGKLPKIPPSWETTLRLLGIACRHGTPGDRMFAELELQRLGYAIDCKDATREEKT